MTTEIINESETFSMGFSYDTGHCYGQDIEYSDGTVIRVVTDDAGNVLSETAIR